MIAKTLLDFLGEDLDIGVYLEQPSDETGYILIDQTGSSQTNHITTTTLAIQSYAPSLYEAMVLNDRIKGAMERFAQLNEVARVELETDYNFTNTTTKQYRWQAVYLITHY